MKEKTVMKRCLALVLTFVLVISGLTIPKGDVTVAEAAEETESATNIVGDEGATADNSEAKIGEAYFKTFASAVTQANQANGDVTIEVLKNISIGTLEKSVINTDADSMSGQIVITKPVTIDGKGHTVTTYAKHTFKVAGIGEVNMCNMTLDCKQQQSVIQVAAQATVNLEDVQINAISKSTGTEYYGFHLISLPESVDASEITLNLTRVNVKMNSGSTSSWYGVVRTGNDSEIKRTININMDGCNWDLTEAPARKAFAVCNGATLNLDIKDSIISTDGTTNHSQIIATGSKANTNLTKTNSKFNNETYEAQIGNTLCTFADAMTQANSSSGTTVEVLKDITIGTKENSILNEPNSLTGQISISKPVTIDGNGHTVTTYAKHTFKIGCAGEVNMCNMTLACNQQQSVMQVNAEATVNFTDVTINATSTSTGNSYYDYHIISLPESTNIKKQTLNFTRVNVTMGTPNTTGSWYGFIRTGNDNADILRTIDINLDSCNWDLTNASNRRAFVVLNGATVNLDIKDSTISTAGTASSQVVVNSSKGTTNLTKTNSVFNNATYEAQVGNDLCSLADAVSKASAGATIEILKDITISNISIAKKLTIDGNNHTITTTSGDAFIIQVADTVELNNMKLAYKSTGVAIRVKTPGADARLTNVDITSTANVEYTLINLLTEGDTSKTSKLTLTNVHVDMDTASNGNSYKAIIRTGNNPWGEGDGYVSCEKNVEITLKDCVLDASEDTETGATGAIDRYGIIIMSTTTAKVSMTNTQLYTHDLAPIKDLSGKADITVSDDCVIGCDTKDAQIGYTAVYSTLAEAITAVKETTTDVTIELLRDVTMDNCDVKNQNGKKITIDGKGYKLTTSGTAADGHAFRIYGSSDGTGTYEFKNMEIEHGKTGNLIQLRSDASPSNKKATVKLTKVDITNKNNGGYLYGLINMLPCGDDANTRLDLTDVDVTMKFDRDDLGTSDGAIIRTGNGHAADQKKTIDINLTNCNFDTTDAAKMRGILVHNYATANITIAGENSIKTKNVAPIEAYGNVTASTITLDGTCVFDSKTEEHKNTPIKGYDAKVGNVVYLRLADAVNATEEGNTIEILRDITLGTLANSGVDNHDTASIGYISITKPITIDGNNHKVTNYAKHGFRINFAGTVTMRDMTFDCYQQQSVIQVNSQATVNLSNIQMNAKGTSAGAIEYYRYGLIAIPESTSVSEVTLNFTRVNVVMDTPAPSGSWCGVIRTGNDNNDVLRTININLDGCNWDLTKAPQRKGFVILNGTTANIDIKNSTISTDGTTTESQIIAASSNGKTNLTKTNCTWNNETYEAQIGNTLCTFAEAIKTAKDSGSNATIELLKDITINACDIYNKNSKVIVIDGNNHTLTTEGTTDEAGAWGNAFRIYGSTDGYGTYEFKNMDIVHAKPGVLVQVHSTGDYTSKNATVKFTNVDITTKKENQDGTVIYGGGNYGLITTLPATLFSEDGITLDFTNVNVDMEVADGALGKDEDKAIIRTGNDGEVKTVTINLTGCNFDTTKASKVSGIVVMKNTHAKINLKDSTIKTKDTYAIKVKKESGLEAMAMDNVKLTSDEKAYAQNPILNSDGHAISSQSTDSFADYRVEAYEDTTYKTYGGEKYFVNNGANATLYSVPSEIVTEGNIFGGWYADEALGTALKISDTSSENTVWAKMVPSHVMGVKAQLSKNLIDGDDTNNSVGTIRFVTTTDSLKYQEMGFRYSVVTADGQETIISGIKSSNQVYEEIYALEENGEVMNYLPSIFCTESEYFKTLIIKDVPSAFFDAKITVRPFWITSDGTIVWGDEVTKTVQEGIDKTGWQSDNTTGFAPSNNEYTNRVILLSDLHYTTNLTPAEYKEKYGQTWGEMLNLKAGPSYAAGPAFGFSQSEKLGEALKDIDNFINAGNTINSVMVLGDMSLDDWGYRDYSNDQDDKGGYSGYLDDFAIDFMDVIVTKYENVSCYAIAGNHDNYTDGDDWNDILSQGTVKRNLGRQYSVEIGNAVFIMLDTFKDEAAYKWNDGGSGSEYLIEQEDVTFLQNELNKVAPDKTIFLCAHYYKPADTTYDNQLAELIANDDRIVCMFQGHTHINGVKNIEKLGGLPLVDIGGYAYNGSQADDGTYDFNIFDPAWAWGYQVLEWNDTEAHIYHVKNPRTYVGTNGTFNYKGAIENEMTFQF